MQKFLNFAQLAHLRILPFSRSIILPISNVSNSLHDGLHCMSDNVIDPLFLSCAETDHTFPEEFRNSAVHMMIEQKKRYQVQLFQGVEHGFALRGNMENAYERYCKEQSLKGIVEWCDFWLSQA